jgi:hypothetical protein
MKRLFAFAAFAFLIVAMTGIASAVVENESDDSTEDASVNASGNAFGEKFREQREEFKSKAEEYRAKLYNDTRQLKEDLEALKELRKQAFEDFKKRIRNNSQVKINGKNLTINELSDDKKELIVGKINAKTGLNLTVDDITNGTAGSILRAYLSNGRWAIVKTMPNVAALAAQDKLKAKCEDRNCTVELVEVGKGNQTRLAYEVTTEKGAKFLWIFNRKMAVKARVDAETGEVVDVKKPWWTFMAKEKDE